LVKDILTHDVKELIRNANDVPLVDIDSTQWELTADTVEGAHTQHEQQLKLNIQETSCNGEGSTRGEFEATEGGNAISQHEEQSPQGVQEASADEQPLVLYHDLEDSDTKERENYIDHRRVSR
jgi:hypothetical protein